MNTGKMPFQESSTTNVNGSMQHGGFPDAKRSIDAETLSRLRLMQMELVEATNTAQLLQQVKELKQERFQLFLELVATRQGIDLQREEIRLADGRVVPRSP